MQIPSLIERRRLRVQSLQAAPPLGSLERILGAVTRTGNSNFVVKIRTWEREKRACLWTENFQIFVQRERATEDPEERREKT